MKRSQTSFHKVYLPFVIAVICLTIFCGSSVFGQGNEPNTAPVNPKFLAHMQALQKGMVMLPAYTETGHVLGFMPSPLNMEHIKGINVFRQAQAQAQTEAQAQAQAQAQMSIPATYDLRSLGKLTPVRNQGQCGSCWAFATYSSLESTLLTAETDNLSENHLKDTHGFDWGYCDGGNGDISTAYLARWSGPVYETDDPYNPYSGTSPSGLSPRKHVQDVYMIPARSSRSDNDNLKNAVMTYGAVYVSMYWASAAYYSANSSYYCGNCTSANHAVAIVGWDDNYPKTNFSPAAPANGAFIVRNSWGSGWGAGGYFYVSYDDATFARSDQSYSFRDAEPTTNFSRVYQYDPFGWVSSYGYGSTTGWFANIFTAAASERLAAVSFYAASPSSTYEIYIYKGVTAGVPKSGTLAATQTGTLQMAGYNTVSLSSPANLTSGEGFSIVVKLTTPGYTWPIPFEFAWSGYSSAATASPGQSFVSSDGNSWRDATSLNATANVCLKGFTAGSAVVYADFAGYGLYEWNGSGWMQINAAHPTSMAASSSALYAAFTGVGIQKWDGTTWTLINGNAAAIMVASGSNLYADFASYGLYQWNGATWTLINGNHPARMVASGSTLYADFTGFGLYSWDGAKWTLLNGNAAASMVASGSNLYADFASYGLYQWNGATWTLINGNHPASMVASGSTLYADFTGFGLYSWDGTTWTLLTGNAAASMVASGVNLYADFASYGLYQWNGATWTLINGSHPASMVAN